MDILENYLNEINENKNFEYLSEDIKSIISKLKNLNLKSIISNLENSAKSKDLNKIKNTVNLVKIPTVSNQNIVDNMKKIKPDFDKSYELSKKVISNSIPELSDKLVDSVSIAVAAKSTLKSNDTMGNTKETLLVTVPQLRKYIGTGVGGDVGQLLGVVIVIIFLIAGIAVVVTVGFGAFIPLVFVGGLLMVLKNLVSD
jgi:tetrahydromethanopterin S-methyltransferase subunit G